MEKTAVEWLFEQLDNNLDINHSWRTRQYIEQAKEMEKQQLIDFYCHTNPDDVILKEFAEQHYNQTYKQD
jgi:hypothetical protein